MKGSAKDKISRLISFVKQNNYADHASQHMTHGPDFADKGQHSLSKSLENFNSNDFSYVRRRSFLKQGR